MVTTLFAICPFLVAIQSPPRPHMDLLDQWASKAELRILVETYRTEHPLTRHDPKADHECGWYIVIDLAGAGDFAERSKVYGPLWAFDGVEIAPSFVDHVEFTRHDVLAGKARPAMTFDDQGRLVRKMPVAPQGLALEAVDTTRTPGVWMKIADTATIAPREDRFGWGRLINKLGRLVLQEEADGRAGAYDLFTGKPKDDAWLLGAFADWRARADLRNSIVWVTEDANYLAIRPELALNENGVMIEDFVFDGIVYSRASYGLVYSRPAIKPSVFKKPASLHGCLVVEPPHGAFSIGGELLLLEIGNGTLRLFSPDGTTKFEWKSKQGLAWEASVGTSPQLDAEAGRLVFFNLRDPADRWFGGENFTMVIWDFKAGTVERTSFDLRKLFKVEKGAYEPVLQLNVGKE